MTDRDDVAKHAMAALVLCHCQSFEALSQLTEMANKAGRTVAQQIASVAYEFADAMYDASGNGEPLNLTNLRQPR